MGMRVGVLTGGGDCPGLNAVIRGIVLSGHDAYRHEYVGIRHGWRGLLSAETQTLTPSDVRGIVDKGGTILGSSRTNPYAHDGGAQIAASQFRALGLDALIAIGGEDTLGVANRLFHDLQIPTVGVPKTIDNDLSGTDYTFGFWTAVQIAVDAIDRLKTTADSHDRIMVLEVMGRHAGWIAYESGLAGGADIVLIPERTTSIEAIIAHLATLSARDQHSAIIVVSEGVSIGTHETGATADEFGHHALAAVGVAEQLARTITDTTGKDARAVVLGHLQRGGIPTAFDRSLASNMGAHAAHMVARGAYGRMAALQGTSIIDIPIDEAVAQLKTVPPERISDSRLFFG
jgi:6-phosphofructokinase 1